MVVVVVVVVKVKHLDRFVDFEGLFGHFAKGEFLRFFKSRLYCPPHRNKVRPAGLTHENTFNFIAFKEFLILV